MKLRELGFDNWFESNVDELRKDDQGIARVSAVNRGVYLVRNENMEIPAELAGKFYYRSESSVDMPCVGDWVTVQYHNNDASAIIHGVFPRKTFLRRKCAGEEVDFQMIAANIDIALIVQSCHYDFNPRRLHRYLVMAADGNVKPIIILTKTDLVSHDDLEQKLASIKQTAFTDRVIALSNITGTGFDELQQVLIPGQTYCLLGSSGVGKTTLINRLIGNEIYCTSSVSGTGEGTHTTACRQLILLDKGAILIDTPGMRELGIIGAGIGITHDFKDVIGLSANCRFSNCTHSHEPGCAVLTAIKDSELSEERYLSYMKLKKESDHHEMSYADKRKKDRAFGRIIKLSKKQKKDWDTDT